MDRQAQDAIGKMIRPDIDVLMDNFNKVPLEDRLPLYLNLIESPALQSELSDHPYTAGNVMFSLIEYLDISDQPKALIALSESEAFRDLSARKPLTVAVPFEGAVLRIGATSKTTLPSGVFETRDKLISTVFAQEAAREKVVDPTSGDAALLSVLKASVASGEAENYRPEIGFH